MAVTDETLELVRRGRLEVAATVDAETRRLARAWARAWDEIAPAMDAALLDSAQTLAEDGRLSADQMRRNRRVRAAVAAADERMTALAQSAGVQIQGDVDDIVAAVDARQRRVLASQLPGDTPSVAATFDRADPDALEAIVRRTTGRIESRNRLLAPRMVEAMRRELTRGVALGSNPREAARRMLSRVEGAFDGGLYRASVITRTEMLDAQRHAALAVEQANSDVVGGWRWFAELDEATCAACVAMHGQQFPPEAFGPEGHPQCRCQRVPVTRSWQELGFDVDEPDDMFPDADEWVATSPDALDALGQQRLDALRDGSITREEMAVRRDNPDWRPSQQEKPLKDLLAA